MDGVILPRAVAEMPWGHNALLLDRLKDPTERLWYARMAVEHGWSRAILDHQIDSHLYRRQGRAITNFTRTLPPPQSDLADEVLKDPYSFDFLTLAKDAHEREVQKGLLAHIRQFLLELGAGFAFVGENVHLEVGGDDFYVDLLFYHLKLRAFIVVDVKVKPFKPAFAGQLNFYLSAVDDLLRHPDDQPSIGIILCKAGNRTVAEYALRDIAKPVGVSTYVTRLVDSLPADLQPSLPTVAELEAELQAAEDPEHKKSPRRKPPQAFVLNPRTKTPLLRVHRYGQQPRSCPQADRPSRQRRPFPVAAGRVFQQAAYGLWLGLRLPPPHARRAGTHPVAG